MSDVGWIRRAEPDRHVCPRPTVGSFGTPAGSVGDLWRCPDCRTLWRIAVACDACDAYGSGRHGGQCRFGNRWRQATGWQRLAAWLRGRR